MHGGIRSFPTELTHAFLGLRRRSTRTVLSPLDLPRVAPDNETDDQTTAAPAVRRFSGRIMIAAVPAVESGLATAGTDYWKAAECLYLFDVC